MFLAAFGVRLNLQRRFNLGGSNPPSLLFY
jgi:hypothetical protein